MVSASFFSGLIALVLAALLGFLAAWIWRGKRMAFLESQAARLRRDRRTLVQRLSQSDSRLDSANFNRNETDQALAELTARHEALEAEYAALAASYANLKQGIVGLAEEDDDWFDGLDSDSASFVLDSADENEPPESNNRAHDKALQELETFEQQLSSASAELARDISDRQSINSEAASTDTNWPAKPADIEDPDGGLHEKLQSQQAEITRLKEQMAPLLGLPLAVSAREAERDRLAGKLESRERELADLNAAVNDLGERERGLQQQLEQLREGDDQADVGAGAGNTDEAKIKGPKKSKKKNKSEKASRRDRDSAIYPDDDQLQSTRGAVVASDEWPDLELGAADSGRPDTGEQSVPVGSPDPDQAEAARSPAEVNGARRPIASVGPKLQAATGLRTSSIKADAASVVAPRQYRKAPVQVDNLKEIKGIGPVLERMLNRLGVYQFRQIASWQEDDITYFDTHLVDFRGRIRRDSWVEGASTAQINKYG